MYEECFHLQHQDLLDHVTHIHFVGIGGSGMCPMAEILHSEGFHLTGSDVYESDTLERIRALGIQVSMGHRAENITGAELVVYTAAVKQDNPELLAAKELGIPALERSVMLGIVCRRYQNAIAVSGTHGKTTTTAMLTQIMVTGGADPTAIIGGRLPFIGGNGRVGKSETMICEACEYVDTFLQLTPAVSIILNVDADHLDYFGNLSNIIKSFHQFAQQTTRALIVNGDDQGAMEAVQGLSLPVITFGLNENNDYHAVEIASSPGVQEHFTLMYHGEILTKISLSVPGKHNIYNALAAAAAAHHAGVRAEDIARGLHEFTGVHRRFEILGRVNGITVADDFAHHPTELTATLSAAMEMGFQRVWAVFQPHTFSRTYLLMDDFAKALSIPDRVVLSDILPVREENTYGVRSEDLAAKIPGCVCLHTFEQIADFLARSAEPGDLVLTLGGGNVYRCAHMILELLKQRAAQNSTAPAKG
jgi:UDP-N-acetylmuramate--alanine ligase